MISQFNNNENHLNTIRKVHKKRKNVKLLKQYRRFVNSPKREKDKPVEDSLIIKPQLP